MFFTRTQTTALRAGFASISRIYEFYRNARQNRFVICQILEFVKRPRTEHFAKPLRFSGTVSDSFKVFKNKKSVLFNRFFNKFLRNYVIHFSGKASLFAGQPFQNSLRAFRAFALKRCFNLLEFFSFSIYFASRNKPAVACSDKAIDTAIHSDCFLSAVRFFFLMFNLNMQSPLAAFRIKNQSCRSRFLLFQHFALVVAKFKTNAFQSSVNTRNRNGFEMRIVFEKSRVQIKRSWFETFRRAFAFTERRSDTRQCSDNVISGKVGVFADWFVAKRVQIKGAIFLFSKRGFENFITRIGKFDQSLLQTFGLFFSWFKFAFNRAYHNDLIIQKVIHFYKEGNPDSNAFLRRLERRRSPAIS